MVVAIALLVAAAHPVSAGEAKRFLGRDNANANTTFAVWNGSPTVFVDYLTNADDPDTVERQLYAVQRLNGKLTKIAVTTGEPEGATAEVAAIGFANANHDPAKELIVILRWPQRHYDVNGDLLEVRLFDHLRPGETHLRPLIELSKHFGSGCDCWDRYATKPRHFRFNTISSVQKELRRLGY